MSDTITKLKNLLAGNTSKVVVVPRSFLEELLLALATK